MDTLTIRCAACDVELGHLKKDGISRFDVANSIFKCDCGHTYMRFFLNGELTDFVSSQPPELPIE